LIGVAASSGASATTGAGASPTTVVVTIRDAGVALAPAVVPTGAVAFKVVNRSTEARDFRIAGKRTPAIAAGKSGSLSVVLGTQGQRPYSSVGRRRGAPLTGLLDVFSPCANPAVTTVNVQMAQDRGGLTISQTAIPCGTVTFVVTNAGSLVDDLQVFSTAPAVAGSTPELQPGQTARLTLRFPAKGLVYYESGDYPPAEPEFGGDYNEGGQLTLV
jgi:hypothetical protein